MDSDEEDDEEATPVHKRRSVATSSALSSKKPVATAKSLTPLSTKPGAKPALSNKPPPKSSASSVGGGSKSPGTGKKPKKGEQERVPYNYEDGLHVVKTSADRFEESIDMWDVADAIRDIAIASPNQFEVVIDHYRPCRKIH